MTAAVLASTPPAAQPAPAVPAARPERLYPGARRVQHDDDIFILDPIAFAYQLCSSTFPEVTGVGLVGAAVLVAVALDRWPGPGSDPVLVLEQLRTAFATGTAGVDELGGWIALALL